jgi:hypothetical protein
MTEPDGLAIRLDATTADVEVPASIAPHIPLASTLDRGTRVTVLPTATRKRSVLGRLLGDRGIPVPRWSRCSALLARGYVDIAAAGDTVWGKTPP